MARPQTRGTFENFLFLLVGVALTIVAVGWVYNRLDAIRGYRERYGEKVSQNSEEWLIRDFFNDRRGGVFVDVGAADYKEFSNTFYLETVLGWSGVAVDAQPSYASGYKHHRDRTKFFAFFVADRDDASVQFFVPTSTERGVASSDRVYVQGTGNQAVMTEVKTITLNTLLPRAGVDRFDFLSMDIERAEPLALAGFDIERFRPGLVCIEAHVPVRQAILNYFADHHYVLVGRYLGLDSDFNLYFMPRADADRHR